MPDHHRCLPEHQTTKTYSARLVRVLVENLFACIGQLCPLLNSKHAHKMGGSPIGLVFPVATLIYNCHNLLYGSTMAASVPGAFEMLASAMTLEEYLQ